MVGYTHHTHTQNPPELAAVLPPPHYLRSAAEHIAGVVGQVGSHIQGLVQAGIQLLVQAGIQGLVLVDRKCSQGAAGRP